jgi:hypothetical protein
MPATWTIAVEYRAMLDRLAALVGNENLVMERIDELRDAGVTEASAGLQQLAHVIPAWCQARRYDQHR